MIRPYYETELGKLYHGDCLEIMQGIEDESIDCIITDPPFFMPAVHYQSRISWGRSFEDLSILGHFFYTLCHEWKRILIETGHLMCFCNDESYPVLYPAAYKLWYFTRALIWDKKRIGLGKIFRHQYEMILWASNQNAYIHNDGKVHSNILVHSPTFSKDRLHPVEKPQSLFEEILDIISCENQTVLDCFCGSGTTLAACENMKRRWIGIEMSREYCDIARKRIEKEAMQLKFI